MPSPSSLNHLGSWPPPTPHCQNSSSSSSSTVAGPPLHSRITLVLTQTVSMSALDDTPFLPVYQPPFIWNLALGMPFPAGSRLLMLLRLNHSSGSSEHLRLSAGDYISATFFAEGAFNKLYAITVSSSGSTLGSPQYIFHATSPVELFFKTASEATTLSYLLEHTSIPVPRIALPQIMSLAASGHLWRRSQGFLW